MEPEPEERWNGRVFSSSNVGDVVLLLAQYQFHLQQSIARQ
jgi:hypothetical protein